MIFTVALTWTRRTTVGGTDRSGWRQLRTLLLGFGYTDFQRGSVAVASSGARHQRLVFGLDGLDASQAARCQDELLFGLIEKAFKVNANIGAGKAETTDGRQTFGRRVATVKRLVDENSVLRHDNNVELLVVGVVKHLKVSSRNEAATADMEIDGGRG